MNWGTSIALVYGIFAASMIGMAFASRNHPPHMVQKDYYALDLNYQSHLEKKQHTAALAEKPTVALDAATQSLRVVLPTGMVAGQGSVKCYQSANSSGDIKVSLENSNTATVPQSQLRYGRWHVELDWVANGIPYFFETTVFVNLAQ